ncbi:MAG: STAS domain-containing protein [Terriglobales bacterium]
MIKVTFRRVDSVAVVDLGGRITLGEGATQLRETIRELLAKGDKQILLNLGEVSYIDSSGLGELVGGFSLVRKQGGDLKLLKLTRKVHDLLQITKLYTVFDVQDDEAQAIAAFGEADAPAEASGAH